MKIAFLAPASVNHTVKIVNEMSDRGHEVHVFSLKDHQQGADKINDSVSVYYLPHTSPLGYYLSVFALRKKLKNVAPDILNVHSASGYGTLARCCGRKPSVLSVWGSDVFKFPLKNGWNRRTLQKNLKFADLIISTSTVMGEETQRYVKTDSPIEIIPYGVDLTRFPPSGKLKREGGSFRIVCIKNLKPVYGIRYLIEAMSLLKQNNSASQRDAQLHIYGSGPGKDSLIKTCKDFDVEDRVYLKGYLKNTEVGRILGEADVCCIPSLRESFGVSVVEGMAAGTPVVATETVGFKEIIENDVDGYLVPTKNAGALADKIGYLMEKRPEVKALTEKARKKVENLYDWKKNMDAFEKALQRVSH